jgi:long-chain acyl-CoA synthetase
MMTAIERPWIRNYDPGVPETIPVPEIPVFHFLDEAARQFPAQPCTVFHDELVSYGEMRRLADRLAAALVNLGLRKGDRVGLFLPNVPQFVMAFYAVLKAGGVVAAMNPQYKQRELEYQLRDSGARFLIGPSSASELFQAVRPLTALEYIVLTAPEDAFTLPGWASGKSPHTPKEAPLPPGDYWLGGLIAAQPLNAQPGVMVTGADTAIFQYSGGTTGIPKAAVGLHRNLVANSLQFRAWLVGLKAGQETTLMAIPMYHVYGMVVGMSVSILLGGKMVLIPDPRSLPDLLANIEKYSTTFFPGVPTMYAMINQNADVLAGKYHLRSVRACISGSAPLLREIRERFEALTGAQLMEGYGLSEAPTATHCNPMFGEKRAGSIGLPLPGVDCRIVDLETGLETLSPGEIGELVLRGPQVMHSYHNRPDETQIALRGGWLYTGDIARMDEDGYFYIVDRKKELIKVAGFQVWPREIEEIIAAQPGVREVSVAGIPDPVRGEAPKAWVVLQPGARVSAEALRAICEETLVYYKVPVEIEFREALPRTLVGKVLRRELVREHLEKNG